MPIRRDNSEPKIRASVLHALQAYAQKLGIGVEDLLSEVGLNEDMVRRPLDFVPLAAVGHLLERVAEITRDDCMGLRLGSLMEGGKTGLLGHLMLTAPTARDAATVLAGYVNVFVTDIECGYEENYVNGLSTGYWRYPDQITERRQLNMFTAASAIQRLRGAMDSDWHPIRVDLEHRRPQGCPKCKGRGCTDCDAVVRRVLGERVHFDQPMNRIIHNTAALNRPMRTSNPMAFTLHLDHARKAISEMTFGEEMADRVRTEIVSKLPKHDATLQSVSAELDLSARALQTKLNQCGTNFEALLTEVREKTARRLLRETDIAITDIAYELGYADPSVFSRAARRWFQESPRDYRMRHRQ